MVRIGVCLVALVFVVAVIGCGSPVKEKVIEVKAASDPLSLPRSVLQRYAEGQPLGSEAASFANMVEEVRKADPAKAGILEAGLKEIQTASPPARAAKAKEILGKL